MKTSVQEATETNLCGLSESEVAERVRAGRVNTLPDRSGRSVWSIVRANVFTRINAMLGILALIVFFTGSLINAMFALLIVCNSLIGVVQELRAKRTLDRLTIIGEAKPVVLRAGRRFEIAREEVVEDDLIVLRAGAQIIVDGVVVEASNVEVDESMLTGESDAIQKEPGGEVLSGSFVVSGTGVYRAVKVGAESYAARLTAESNKFSLVNSELVSGINKILRIITWLLIPVGVLTVWTQLFRTGENLREALLAMVASLVPMIPEGLVLMTSIAFAVGVVRLGKYQALVNELPAIEGLARVDVVCTDKTGTLTENRMVLREFRGCVGVSEGEARKALVRMLACDEDRNDTAQALFEGLGASAYEGGECPVDAIPFSSARKWSAVRFSNVVVAGSGEEAGVGADGQLSYFLGAADVLSVPGSEVAKEAERFAQEGYRVLLFASSPLSLQEVRAEEKGASSTASSLTPTLLRPLALIVLEQKIRDDAFSTIEFFHRENVEVKVISGDNAISVAEVAHRAGIESDVTVDARTLPALDAGEPFDEAIERGTVFGRVTPEQKRAMVGALQRCGHTVAMTGDGVNDVLALKDADIGVAMGSGSPASRSVAQLVLLNNSFATLPRVVAEGRRVIGNIERVANLFLTKTVYSIVLASIIGLFGIAFPFQPVHVTITGWFTIGIPAFILSLAPNHEPAQPGFASRVLRLALPSGLVIGFATVLFWILHLPGAGASEQLRAQAATATLVVLILLGLWILGIVARPYTWWKVLLLVVSAGAYVVIFTVPVIAKAFFLDVSNGELMVHAFVFAFVGACCIEVVHRLNRGGVLNQGSVLKRGVAS